MPDSTAHLYFWCVLFINFNATKKLKTEVRLAIDPMTILKELNNEFGNAKIEGRKSSGENKVNWGVYFIIGEFFTREQAKDFVKLWKNGTRGIDSRIIQGIKLSIANNKNIYVNDDDDGVKRIRDMYINIKNNGTKETKKRKPKNQNSDRSKKKHKDDDKNENDEKQNKNDVVE